MIILFLVGAPCLGVGLSRIVNVSPVASNGVRVHAVVQYIDAYSLQVVYTQGR